MKHRMPGYAGSWGYPAPRDIQVGDRVNLEESHSSDPRPVAVGDENGSHVVTRVHYLHGTGDDSHCTEVTVSVEEVKHV